MKTPGGDWIERRVSLLIAIAAVRTVSCTVPYSWSPDPVVHEMVVDGASTGVSTVAG